MNSSDLTTYAIAAAILYGAFKFGPGPVKGMAIAVAGVAIAKRVPYLNAVV